MNWLADHDINTRSSLAPKMSLKLSMTPAGRMSILAQIKGRNVAIGFCCSVRTPGTDSSTGWDLSAAV